MRLLGPLANNGGQTQTMALLIGSPAINAGDNALAVAPNGTALTTDQRGSGYQRIIDTVVDMGSFEFHFPAFPLVVTTAADVLHDNVVNPLQLSLRDAVALANSYIGAGPAEITFAPSLAGVPIDLSLGELLITGSVQIVGLGAKNTVIDAEGNSRVFEVAASAGNVTFSSLTVTGGETTAASADGGGILFLSPGVLTLSNVAVTNNSVTGAGSLGGGIYTASGAVTVLNSTISGNTNAYAARDGGGIFSQNGAVTLTNSTLADNSVAGYNADGAGIYALNAGGCGHADQQHRLGQRRYGAQRNRRRPSRRFVPRSRSSTASCRGTPIPAVLRRTSNSSITATRRRSRPATV